MKRPEFILRFRFLFEKSEHQHTDDRAYCERQQIPIPISNDREDEDSSVWRH